MPTRPPKQMTSSLRLAKPPHPSCILDGWLVGAACKCGLFCKPAPSLQRENLSLQRGIHVAYAKIMGHAYKWVQESLRGIRKARKSGDKKGWA